MPTEPLWSAVGIDAVIRVVLALTAIWFVIAAVWLMRLQSQVRRNFVAVPATRVHLAWLAIPLLAVPGGWLMQPESAESQPTNLAESSSQPDLPQSTDSVPSAKVEGRDNHPSPMVAVSHPVHPI